MWELEEAIQNSTTLLLGWVPAVIAGVFNLLVAFLVDYRRRRSDSHQRDRQDRSDRRRLQLSVLQQAQIEMDRLEWASVADDANGDAKDAAIQFDEQKTRKAEAIFERARPAVPDELTNSVNAACSHVEDMDNQLKTAMKKQPPNQVAINQHLANLLQAREDYRVAMKDAVTEAYHDTVSADDET